MDIWFTIHKEFKFRNKLRFDCQRLLFHDHNSKGNPSMKNSMKSMDDTPRNRNLTHLDLVSLFKGLIFQDI